jgi:hypothetical protein
MPCCPLNEYSGTASRRIQSLLTHVVDAKFPPPFGVINQLQSKPDAICLET